MSRDYRSEAIAKSLAAGDRTMFDARVAEEQAQHPELSRAAAERRLLTEGDLYAHYTQAVLAGTPRATPTAPVVKRDLTPRERVDAELSRRQQAVYDAGRADNPADAAKVVFDDDPAFYQLWRWAGVPGAPVVIMPQFTPSATPGVAPTPATESDRGLVGR